MSENDGDSGSQQKIGRDRQEAGVDNIAMPIDYDIS